MRTIPPAAPKRLPGTLALLLVLTAWLPWNATPAAIAACSGSFTPIYAIQGSGMSAAITGTVTTQGVVIGDYEGPSPALRGFYIQDEDTTRDNDPETSEGIFIYEGSNANAVSLGDVVQVTGTAGEYQGQTEINASAVTICGSGAAVVPVDVSLPVLDSTYLERYEGMLVHFQQNLYVTETYQLGHFGEVLLSSSERLKEPTQIALPGADARAVQAQNNLNQILLDDASQTQYPDPIVFGRGGQPLSASNTLRAGDYASQITGVLTYTWAGDYPSHNAYRLRPINALGGGAPDFQPGNPRPAIPADASAGLRVVGMNLLNYFNTFADGNASTPGCFPSGTDTDCRGAKSQAEFDRQWPKTVAAILATGGDVIGVTELENDGYGPTSAIQDLVTKLNNANAQGQYAFIDADAATRQAHALGGDAIKVGLLYQPGKVTPAGQTAVLNTPDFINGGDSSPRNRAALAQAFKENATGQIFVVIVNHFKSKGNACDYPDTRDGQGNCNTVRTMAAHQLAAWLATTPTSFATASTLILGDLNSYARE
ncbi:MAG TPA: ExeM/NucH family extracellular endonuclease, partial [Anaerolineaceae bacterium]